VIQWLVQNSEVILLLVITFLLLAGIWRWIISEFPLANKKKEEEK